MASRKQVRRTIKEADRIIEDSLTGVPVSFAFARVGRRERAFFGVAPRRVSVEGSYFWDKSARVKGFDYLIDPGRTKFPEIFVDISLSKSRGRVTSLRKYAEAESRIGENRLRNILTRAFATGNGQELANLLDSLPGVQKGPFSTAVSIDNGDLFFA